MPSPPQSCTFPGFEQQAEKRLLPKHPAPNKRTQAAPNFTMGGGIGLAHTPLLQYTAMTCAHGVSSVGSAHFRMLRSSCHWLGCSLAVSCGETVSGKRRKRTEELHSVLLRLSEAVVVVSHQCSQAEAGTNCLATEDFKGLNALSPARLQACEAEHPPKMLSLLVFLLKRVPQLQANA